MPTPQSAILAPVPPLARYLTFVSSPGAEPRAGLAALRELTTDLAEGVRRGR